MIRHRIMALVPLIIAVVLSSCDLSIPATPVVTTPTTTSATAGAAIPVEPTATLDDTIESDKPVTITFAALEWQRPFFDPLIRSFNADNPDMHVQFVATDSVIHSDQPLDFERLAGAVARLADTALPFVATPDQQRRYMLDLTPFMDSDTSFQRDDFYSNAFHVDSQDGSIRLLPRTSPVAVLSYNKDLFTKRGLPVPPPDWMWNDMRVAAEGVAQKTGDTVTVYGLVEDNGALALTGELAAADPSLQAASSAEISVDRPASLEALNLVAAMVRSGAVYVQPSTDTYFDSLSALVLQGRVGMWPTDLLRGGNTSLPPFAVGTVAFPSMPLPFASSIDGYAISAGTLHPGEAWRWLSFLSHQNVNLPDVADDTIAVPARKSVAEGSGYWKRLDEQTAAAVQATLARPTPMSSAAQAIALRLNRMLIPVVRGEKSVEQAVHEVQSALDEEIAQAQRTPQPTPDGTPIIVAIPPPAVVPENATMISFTTIGIDAVELQRKLDVFHQEHPEIVVDIKDRNNVGGPSSLVDAAANSDCFAGYSAPRADEITVTLDLQPLIEADAAFTLDDYPPTLLAPFQHTGGLYGLPYDVRFNLLAYNQTMFDAAHLPYPTADWTSDDFLNAAEKLTGGTGEQKHFGFALLDGVQTSTFLFLDWFGAAATRGNGDVANPNFTDPKVAQALRSYIDLLRNDSPHQRLQGYTSEANSDSALQLINEGRVGMWFTSDFLSFDRRGNFTAAIAPLSSSAQMLTTNDTASTGVYISARTQHPEACWTWLKYLSDVSLPQGGFPARRSVAESDAFLTQAPPGASEVYRAYRMRLDQAPAGLMHNPFDSQIDFFWLFRAIDHALQGKDLRHELADAQSLTEQFLACVRVGTPGSVCAPRVDAGYNGWQNSPSSP